uniref:Uncharacterized protein n=1 Tax=Knipowitschia caucasica TaxID=637954 RepID=A0AAV2KWD2_KNICA
MVFLNCATSLSFYWHREKRRKMREEGEMWETGEKREMREEVKGVVLGEEKGCAGGGGLCWGRKRVVLGEEGGCDGVEGGRAGGGGGEETC